MTGQTLAEVLAPHDICSCPVLLDVTRAAHLAQAVTAHLAAILADPETVEAVEAAVRRAAYEVRFINQSRTEARAAAAIAVIAARLGVAS